ncbi:SdpI family protein [Streptococcus fryi]
MTINRKKGLITSVVIFLPMLIGLLLWKQLPEELPTHFNLNGEPDGYSSKQFVIFVMPLIFLGVHWFTLLMTSFDPKKENISPKMLALLYLLIPGMTILISVITYGYALNWLSNPSRLVVGLLAIIFITIGNYLPKLKQNYTVGIKLPWTLDNEENWRKTHRFTGRLWVFTGFAMFLMNLLVQEIHFYVFLMIVPAILLPFLYSFALSKKR